MKKLTLFLLLAFAVQSSLAQEPKPLYHGSQFKKTIENNSLGLRLENILPDGTIERVYNVDSKTDVEKMFFGRINSPVEFFLDSYFLPPLGFRILVDSLNKSYNLEVKYIANFEEVNKQMDEEYPTKGFSFSELGSLTKEMMNESAKHNDLMRAKQKEESLKLYQVRTLTFPVSKQFAVALHKKTSSAIKNFDSTKIGRQMGCDDEQYTTFRTVVGNEVWTFKLKEYPLGDFLLLSDLCRQIISDAQAGKFNEATYLEKLK